MRFVGKRIGYYERKKNDENHIKLNFLNNNIIFRFFQAIAVSKDHLYFTALIFIRYNTICCTAGCVTSRLFVIKPDLIMHCKTNIMMINTK